MSDQHQVTIASLIEISAELIDSFFLSHDLYSLLVLALVTTTFYSRKKRHLPVATRVELAIAFLPDLVEFLHTNNTVTSRVAKELLHQCKSRQEELPTILSAYLYVAQGLCVKEASKKKKKELGPCTMC